jgi:hypothetical protein
MPNEALNDEEFSIPTASYGDKPWDDIYLKKDSVTTFCPIPPFGNQVDTGKTSIYFATIRGLQGVSYTDPSKTEGRYLVSHGQRARNGQEAVIDPLEALIEERKEEPAKIEARLAVTGKAAGKTPEQIARAVAKEVGPIKEWLERYSVRGKAYMWVLQKNGRYGRLIFGWKVKNEFEKLAKDLQQKILASGVSPRQIGAYAGWYDITRIGNGFIDPDKITLHLKPPTTPGSLAQEPDIHVWTGAAYKDAAAKLPTLESLRDRDVFPISVHEELASLLRANNFAIAPQEVDRILGVTERRGKAKAGAQGSTASKEAPKAVEDDDDNWANEAGTVASVTATAQPATAAASPESDDVSEMFKD